MDKLFSSAQQDRKLVRMVLTQAGQRGLLMHPKGQEYEFLNLRSKHKSYHHPDQFHAGGAKFQGLDEPYSDVLI